MPVNKMTEQGRNLLPDYAKTGKVNGITTVRNREGSLTLSGTSASNALRMIGQVSVNSDSK